MILRITASCLLALMFIQNTEGFATGGALMCLGKGMCEKASSNIGRRDSLAIKKQRTDKEKNVYKRYPYGNRRSSHPARILRLRSVLDTSISISPN